MATSQKSLVAMARDGLPFPTTRRFATAADGTRIAFYTHDAPHPASAPPARAASFPSVVLTNGLSTTARFWKHIAKELAPDHRVVDWSYRGHGESELARADGYALATHVDDLVRVTEAAVAAGADDARPPLHVAFSMGVNVVLELYRRRPDLVRGMVLIAGGADHPYASVPVLRSARVRGAVRATVRALTPALTRAQPLVKRVTAIDALVPLAKATGAIGASAPQADIAHFFQSVGAMDQRAYWETLTSLLDARASDVLPTVRVPVHVIAPERDVMALRRDLEALRDGLAHTNAEWSLLEGTGHAILLEQGGVVAAKIRALSSRLP